MTDLPTPGSKDATDQGCTCPVVDNHYGRGYFGFGDEYGWVMQEDCPIHGIKQEEAK